ncbi:TPA: acyltransferase, partial [Enterobacter hormaechei]|nr:acyltransferase [Enterobacter hormaechei]
MGFYVEYRYDINGLRAIAVLAVVLFHFNIDGFNGGFAGVDIFFVISGFLMTGIIFSRLDSASFSLADFYMARCKRIIPALAALCIAVMIACWFILIPADYESLGNHVLSSMLFISNNTYFSEVNYFDADSHSKWLLHTWSLSVEWQ